MEDLVHIYLMVFSTLLVHIFLLGFKQKLVHDYKMDYIFLMVRNLFRVFVPRKAREGSTGSISSVAHVFPVGFMGDLVHSFALVYIAFMVHPLLMDYGTTVVHGTELGFTIYSVRRRRLDYVSALALYILDEAPKKDFRSTPS